MTEKYVVCIKGDDEYHFSLKFRSIYRVLPDAVAAKHGWIRVIDETGEDYLYPRSRFEAVDLTAGAEQALFAADEMGQDTLVTERP